MKAHYREGGKCAIQMFPYISFHTPRRTLELGVKTLSSSSSFSTNIRGTSQYVSSSLLSPSCVSCCAAPSSLVCSTRGSFSSAWKAIITPFTSSSEPETVTNGGNASSTASEEKPPQSGGEAGVGKKVEDHASSSTPAGAAAAVTPPTLSFLATPTTLLDSVDETIEISRELLGRIATASNAQEKHDLIDTTSNVLCLLLDPCEFVRQIHPDDAYKQGASEAFQRGYAFMSEANSRRDLYDVICALDSPQGHSELNEESIKNVIQLRRDMESNGIHLGEAERNRVTKMNIHKEELAMQLLMDDPCSKAYYRTLQQLLCERFELAQLLGFDSFAQQQLRGTMLEKPENVWGFLCSMDDKYRSEAEREFGVVEAYAGGTGVGSSSHSPGPVCPLGRRRSAITDDQRSHIASLLRHQAEPPEANAYFSVANCIRGIQCLCSEVFGVRLEHVPFDSRTENYNPLAKKYHVFQNVEGRSEPDDEMAKAGSAGATTSHCNSSGSGKNGKGNQFLGVIVLDLYKNEKKYCQAGHLTIQLGCRPHQNVVKMIKALSDRLPARQYPIVALTCNVPPAEGPNRASTSSTTATSGGEAAGEASTSLGNGHVGINMDDETTLIDPHSVKTLFHEFGHAMHTIFGQTTVQNLAGTRSSIDFVETFSQLFELFLTSYDFLRLWAKHVHTKEPISRDLVEKCNKAANMFVHLDRQDQIILSAVDQALHGPQPLRVYCTPSALTSVTSSPSGGPVPRILTHVNIGEIGNFCRPEKFQLQAALVEMVKPFTIGTPTPTSVLGALSTEHLVGYPGGYYGYLYSLTIARQIWATKFEKNPLNRAAGQELVDKVMRFGAACNAKKIMESYLEVPLKDIEVWG